MNISHHISPNLAYHLGCFQGKLTTSKLLYPEDVALALDELCSLAWAEVRSLYPPSHVIEGEVLNNTSSISVPSNGLDTAD